MCLSVKVCSLVLMVLVVVANRVCHIRNRIKFNDPSSCTLFLILIKLY